MSLNGIYRGFSPTDESGVGLGELEITFETDVVKRRFATGLEIWSDEIPRSFLRELSTEELALQFMEDAELSGVNGYTLTEDGPIFILLPEVPDHPEACTIIVRRPFGDDMSDMLGPTFLFNPDQVAGGHFQVAWDQIEALQEDVGVIPRLSNNGERV